MTRLFLAAAFFCLSVLPGQALDRATLSIIGYGSDGQTFAYEEFSIGDEGTPPHSSIHVIDLTNGMPLAGTPFVAAAGEDDESLNAVRDSVWGMAGELLAERDITELGNPLMLLGDGDRNPATALTFGVPGSGEPGSISGENVLTLGLIDMPQGTGCDIEGGAQKGFSLTLGNEGGTRKAHADTALPKERACATGYRLYSVVSPHNGGGVESWVALVSVFSRGFEGNDRRFVAVPLGLTAK